MLVKNKTFDCLTRCSCIVAHLAEIQRQSRSEREKTDREHTERLTRRLATVRHRIARTRRGRSKNMDIESAKSKEVSKYYTCTNLKSSVILYDDSYAWYIGTMLFQFYNTSIILYSKIAIFELNARKPILSHVYFIWKYHSNNSNKMQVKGFSNFSSNDCHVIFFLHLYVCPYINFQKICC